MKRKFTKAEKYLSEKDEVLAKIISTIELKKIESTDNVFHDLLSCIIEQQIHYRSTKKIFANRLKEAGLTEITLPDFEKFEQTAFQNIKLSAKKYETINGLLEFYETKDFAWKDLEDQEVRAKLKSIKGIGPWTIDMILIYSLGRKDIFPVDDYHAKKIFAKAYGFEKHSASELKKKIKEISKAWTPFRSIAFRYLINWKEYLKK